MQQLRREPVSRFFCTSVDETARITEEQWAYLLERIIIARGCRLPAALLESLAHEPAREAPSTPDASATSGASRTASGAAGVGGVARGGPGE